MKIKFHLSENVIEELAQAIAIELRRIADEGKTPDADGGSEGEASAPARRIRRPRRAAASEAANDNEPAEQPKRRRARKSDTSDVGEPAGEEPKRRTSRRSSNEEVATEQRPQRRSSVSSSENTSSGPTVTPGKPQRRRRTSSGSDTVDGNAGRTRRRVPTPSEPTAEDLAKAASEGARHLTPAGVMAILAELKVDGIGGLEGSAKQDFVDRVNEEIGAAT